MKYRIYNALDQREKENRAAMVEEAFKDKTTPIPIKGLADIFLDGLKAFLLELEYQGEPKEIEVEFRKGYEGKINFETDACTYMNLRGVQYYAWAKGLLEVTDKKIFLLCDVFWDDYNA